VATVDVRTTIGANAGSVPLDAAIFGVEPNVAVMHQVVVGQLATRRSGTQSTLTRAEVRGGGAKPWRQKGSGRARQGSTRAPHWKGGGVALGPKPRSYKQRTPKKMVALALRSALSDRAAEGRVAVVEAWDFPTPRTKDAKAALEALGLTGRVLVVLDRDDENAEKSFRNLPTVQLILASELNAYDVLCCDWVVFTRANLPRGRSAEAEVEAEVAGSAGPAEGATPAATAYGPAPASTAPASTAPASEPTDEDFERVVRHDDA
jgi:large subunit ribosomal protein L4